MRTTHIVFRARRKVFAHSCTVAECVNVGVSEAMNFGEMQHGQGVVRVVVNAQVALLVHVIQKIGSMVLVLVPEISHGVEQCDQCISKMLGDKRPPEDPCEEVSSREVVVECVRLVLSRRRWDVEVNPLGRVPIMPLIQIAKLVKAQSVDFGLLPADGSLKKWVA